MQTLFLNQTQVDLIQVDDYVCFLTLDPVLKESKPVPVFVFSDVLFSDLVDPSYSTLGSSF